MTMGHVTIYFVGVCVHLRDKVVEGVDHRVVLINASREEKIHQYAIDPHLAKLRIGTVGTPAPDGALLTIPNAVLNAVEYDSTFDCIPRLADYADTLPPLSDAMVRGKDKTLAAAYFDAAGKFYAEATSGGAAIARLEVATDGPPVLQITPFESAAFPEQTVTLPNVCSIDIVNIGGPESTEHDYDFLLNFKIFERIPDKAWWPTEKRACPRFLRLDYGTIGPGCSNSNYP
jgi:hypothetical protein